MIIFLPYLYHITRSIAYPDEMLPSNEKDRRLESNILKNENSSEALCFTTNAMAMRVKVSC